MKLNFKWLLILFGIFIIIFSFQYFIKDSKPVEVIVNTGEIISSPPITPIPTQPSTPQIREYRQDLDKLIIEVGSQNIYTDNPTTNITFYAVDSSNNPVRFNPQDRAFVRTLGITRLININSEISHPVTNGVVDYTKFYGNLTISQFGTYVVKICLGPNINLGSTGEIVWPFGCYEDQTSMQMNVKQK
ncbi:MAG TPA: hypothetical protein VJB35_05900 [Candidatus Nanoarchaeia archaeon]|nr:hypothetical protein [Candidatus Nanoarchaeia archaeon]